MVSSAQRVSITPAYLRDIPAIIDVDLAAGQLFKQTGLLQPDALADHVPEDILKLAVQHGHLDVARIPGDGLVGFTLVSRHGRELYLDQVSVSPVHGQQGIGRRLVQHVLTKASELGLVSVTLSTFRGIPWNEPFYASMGFEIIPRRKMAPYMRSIEEAQKPHMDVSRRVFMIKRLRRGLFRVKTPA